MIHYDKSVTYAKLAKVKPMAVADAGKNFKAVSHKEAIDAFLGAACDVGFYRHAKEPRLALSHNKAVMAGVWDVEGGPKLPNGVTLQLGVVSGTDRHTPLTVYAGVQFVNKVSAVFRQFKAPGRATIHACTRGRLGQAMQVVRQEADDEFADLVKLYQTDTSRSEYDLLEAVVRGAEWKLYPWSSVEAGIAWWRSHVRTYSVTPLDIITCQWACLTKTNPVTHLRAGMEFNTILFA